MYSQFIYFLIVLTVYTLEHPGKVPPFSSLAILVLNALIFLVFVSIAAYSFVTLKRKTLENALFLKEYQRVETHLNTLALGFIAIHVYILEIKYYINQIPFSEEFITFSGLIALLLLGLYQVVIWSFGYEFQKFPGGVMLSRGAYVKANINFNIGILAPWFLISFFFDLLQLLVKRTNSTVLEGDTSSMVIIVVLLILFACFGPVVIVRLWNCKPLADGGLKRSIETFCQRHKFRFKKILLWPIFLGRVLTAGVIGFLPNWRYLLITEGLLDVLSSEELEGVVGHEMGHIKRFHLPLYLFLLVAYIVSIYVTWDAIFLLTLQIKPLSKLLLLSSKAPNLASLIYAIPLIMMLVIYFRYIFGFFMRNCERQADLYALQLLGTARPLVSALEKIGILSGNIRDMPSWHHYSIRQRVEFLRLCESRPNRIRDHDRKLYASLFAFVLVVATLCWGGIRFKGSSFEKKLRAKVELEWLQSEQFKTRLDEVQFNLAVGSLMLERGREELAERFLKKALELDGNNADALNNLAWLYVTAKDKRFHHPLKGLKLAERAVNLKKVPYILDTLAEAYYVNGYPGKAVQTIKEALKLKPQNRSYYEKQLRKFLERLK